MTRAASTIRNYRTIFASPQVRGWNCGKGCATKKAKPISSDKVLRGLQLSGDGYEAIVSLTLSLKHQKIEITTGRTARIGAADFRTGRVDAAAPVVLVEKRTDCGEVEVMLMLHQIGASAFTIEGAIFGVAVNDVIPGNSKMRCDPIDIRLGEFDHVIGAAKARAFAAIELFLCQLMTP